MKIIIYRLHAEADSEKVWEALENLGGELLFSESGGDLHLIYGLPVTERAEKEILGSLPEIVAITHGELPEIDWEAQWKEHGKGYREGYLEIDVRDYLSSACEIAVSPLLRLIAGPGFGDLSHPTTRLALKLMSKYVNRRDVLDIGCGSGVLSLAGLAMGASTASGIDIDELALAHSKENAALNGMTGRTCFVLPDNISSIPSKGPFVALMNMIQSEQEVAWASVSTLHDAIDSVVTSGILLEGKDNYLTLCSRWGWKLVEEREEEGWIGFVFTKEDVHAIFNVVA